jgi:dihydroxyacetone kinase
MHFGLAAEKAILQGYEKVAMTRVTDDVAVGRKKSELVGRRGLAGHILGMWAALQLALARRSFCVSLRSTQNCRCCV